MPDGPRERFEHKVHIEAIRLPGPALPLTKRPACSLHAAAGEWLEPKYSGEANLERLLARR